MTDLARYLLIRGCYNLQDGEPCSGIQSVWTEDARHTALVACITGPTEHIPRIRRKHRRGKVYGDILAIACRQPNQAISSGSYIRKRMYLQGARDIVEWLVKLNTPGVTVGGPRKDLNGAFEYMVGMVLSLASGGELNAFGRTVKLPDLNLDLTRHGVSQLSRKDVSSLVTGHEDALPTWVALRALRKLVVSGY